MPNPNSSTDRRLDPAPSAGALALLERVAFDAAGLVPAIAQDAATGQVLMLAWMNCDALLETLATGRAVYWSRSRQSLWRKGETSGQTQGVVELRLDCDGDAVLLRVEQVGVACHTGRRSCFFVGLSGNQVVEFGEPEVDPATLYGTKP